MPQNFMIIESKVLIIFFGFATYLYHIRREKVKDGILIVIILIVPWNSSI